MNYYIADCHFGDGRVIEFSHRPFSSVEEMDSYMLDRWNRTVNDSDDVYIVGDLIHRAEDPEKYLKKLKGRLHLIIGNHDSWIIKRPELEKYFVEINNYLVVKDRGHRIVLFHYPLLEWDGYYYGTWHIFGHIHNHPSLTSERIKVLDKALNCGADILGFQPVNFDDLVTINKRDDKREKRPQGSV